MKIEDCKNIKEYAQVVSQHLHDRNIDNILTGGACVSIYTNEKYRSNDLDFLIVGDVQFKNIRSALKELGFEEKGRIFLHRKFEISVDLVSPPLTIGEEHITKVNEIKEKNTLLKLLTPTDCVKDRLAAYFHWDDQQSLNQALLVCEDSEVDINDVKEWSQREGMMKKFKIFEDEFNLKQKKY
ncbi:MAG: hypothetical protein KAR14_01360 [Candidatus Aminicenantes bacterium]|nr:hypothetical protein [Candidatus Aminicenantes bacterium]